MLKSISELDNAFNFLNSLKKFSQEMVAVAEEVVTPYKRKSWNSCTEFPTKLH
jgi:hypothetical protein